MFFFAHPCRTTIAHCTGPCQKFTANRGRPSKMSKGILISLAYEQVRPLENICREPVRVGRRRSSLKGKLVRPKHYTVANQLGGGGDAKQHKSAARVAARDLARSRGCRGGGFVRRVIEIGHCGCGKGREYLQVYPFSEKVKKQQKGNNIVRIPSSSCCCSQVPY